MSAQTKTGEALSDVIRRRVAALVLLALMAGIATLTVAMYQQRFTETATITVEADRAGLQMRKGTIVKIRGVDAGRIEKAAVNDTGEVDIVMAIKPEMLKEIPSNVEVSLEQLTAFGNKAVVLRSPSRPSLTTVEAGDVLTANRVSVEANQLFEDLNEVLGTLEPAKVNSTLSAIAEAVQGQGDELGEALEATDSYLKKINQDLPTLKRDFDKGSDVLDVYTAATPDLLDILSNGSTTAKTVASRGPELHAFLTSLDGLSAEGTKFTSANNDRIIKLLDTALPTTRLLKKYSPEYACFLQAMDHANTLAEKNFGGVVPGATANLSVMGQGSAVYKNPENLPAISADAAPECYDLPEYDGSYFPARAMRSFDPGLPEGPYGGDALTLNDEPLSVQLFGPLAGFTEKDK